MRLLVLLVALALALAVVRCAASGPEAPWPAPARTQGATERPREPALSVPGEAAPAQDTADIPAARRPVAVSDTAPAAAAEALDVVQLHVRDAETLAELEGIELWADAVNSSILAFSSAGPPPPVLRDERSPVRLSRATLVNERGAPNPPWNLAVAVEGYARGSLEGVDPRLPGPRFLELQRAGALEVTLVDAPHGATLRVWDDGGAPPDAYGRDPLRREVRRSGSKRERVQGLVPGPVRVALEAGSWWAERRVYAEVRASVRAGATTHVELACPPQAPVGNHRLDVRLELPLGWTNVRPAVRLYRVGPPAAPGEPSWNAAGFVEALPGGRRGTLEASFLDVPPGPYLVDLARQWSALVHVPPRDTTLSLAVPDLAALVLRVVGPEGQTLPASDLTVRWTRPDPEDLPGQPRVGAQTYTLGQAETQPFELRVPAGPLALEVRGGAESLLFAEERLTLAPGANEHTLRLQRAAGLVVRLVDRGDPEAERPEPFEVRWPGSTALALLNASGARVEPTGRVQRSEGGGLRLAVPTPGLHTLEPPTPDGYEPIGSRTVFLRTGEWTEEVVPLVRRRRP